MFGSGMALMGSASLLQRPLLPEETSSGIACFDLFTLIGTQFTKQLTGAGFILMILFGYTAYMKCIGANQMDGSSHESTVIKLKA